MFHFCLHTHHCEEDGGMEGIEGGGGRVEGCGGGRSGGRDGLKEGVEGGRADLPDQPKLESLFCRHFPGRKHDVSDPALVPHHPR